MELEPQGPQRTRRDERENRARQEAVCNFRIQIDASILGRKNVSRKAGKPQRILSDGSRPPARPNAPSIKVARNSQPALTADVALKTSLRLCVRSVFRTTIRRSPYSSHSAHSWSCRPWFCRPSNRASVPCSIICHSIPRDPSLGSLRFRVFRVFRGQLPFENHQRGTTKTDFDETANPFVRSAARV